MIRRPLPVPPTLPIRASLAAVLCFALALSGCTTTGSRVPSVASVSEKAANMHEAGLERVIGKSARDLTTLFGEADLDGREGQARRMQFVGPACVLDAYLYPPKTGGEPIVSYIDARLPNGDDIDRASCISALTRRTAAGH